MDITKYATDDVIRLNQFHDEIKGDNKLNSLLDIYLLQLSIDSMEKEYQRELSKNQDAAVVEVLAERAKKGGKKKKSS